MRSLSQGIDVRGSPQEATRCCCRRRPAETQRDGLRLGWPRVPASVPLRDWDLSRGSKAVNRLPRRCDIWRVSGPPKRAQDFGNEPTIVANVRAAILVATSKR